MNIYKTNNHEISNQEISHIDAAIDVKNRNVAIDSLDNPHIENEHSAANSSSASSHQSAGVSTSDTSPKKHPSTKKEPEASTSTDISRNRTDGKSHPLGSQTAKGYTVTNGRSSASNAGHHSSKHDGTKDIADTQAHSAPLHNATHAPSSHASKGGSSPGDFDLDFSTDKVQVNCHVHQTDQKDQKQRSSYGAAGSQTHSATTLKTDSS